MGVVLGGVGVEEAEYRSEQTKREERLRRLLCVLMTGQHIHQTVSLMCESETRFLLKQD